MELKEAARIAESVKERLAPHCLRVEIGGSVRREKPNVKDIEIVCVPKPYETGLFASGIATVVDEWKFLMGVLGPKCKYAKRELPEGINLDLFIAKEDNFGLILLIRTGSSEWNIGTMIPALRRNGYFMEDGRLWAENGASGIATRKELHVFQYAGLSYVPPKMRV
jgi:DNA polymerase/3'-5' exonuclease PolX